MRLGRQNSAVLTAVISAMSFVPPAYGADLSELLGSWSDADGAYGCSAGDGTETQALSVAAAGQGLSVGAYAWGCTVDRPKLRGAFLGGKATCASEGDGEMGPGTIGLALTGHGQLVLVHDIAVDVLSACPVKP